jgi:hypothetical protein
MIETATASPANRGRVTNAVARVNRTAARPYARGPHRTETAAWSSPLTGRAFLWPRAVLASVVLSDRDVYASANLMIRQ